MIVRHVKRPGGSTIGGLGAVTHWSFEISLRPGTDEMEKGIVHGETEAAGMSAMDEWIREHGLPGDMFEWARRGPADAGAGSYGHGVVSAP
jgi:hypothetical protein